MIEGHYFLIIFIIITVYDFWNLVLITFISKFWNINIEDRLTTAIKKLIFQYNIQMKSFIKAYKIPIFLGALTSSTGGSYYYLYKKR